VQSLDRDEIIKRSLRCFTFGLLGLLPGIGLSFSILSISDFFEVIRRKGSDWNPADRYLRWGATCAAAGLLLNFALGAVLAYKLF